MSGSSPVSARFTMFTFFMARLMPQVVRARSMAASVWALVKPLAVAPSLRSTRYVMSSP